MNFLSPDFYCAFYSQGVLINILVYCGYIKNIFQDSSVDDKDYLSIKLQVSITLLINRINFV